mmetsp:Transcript_1941/g.2026  ORF Transcript_1941/g.2026 Transcript_1941/m.2026 type:complete len:693 (-) Transcript_1941:52-2130(-)|eukprot:CAMPEP_0182416536 /NCGR_PEP_ID=MMETSP1167-20130531/852_1 /TAXON_ID=2988 /ORGANISM="Mallomonas Sp, Strain CCMP3275" /LENGTH=692 /DNA_ID=CAMNT_0024589373 /DNA_START=60 /DNA_END=2138 /DNA_ORIENTATION=+
MDIASSNPLVKDEIRAIPEEGVIGTSDQHKNLTSSSAPNDQNEFEMFKAAIVETIEENKVVEESRLILSRSNSLGNESVPSPNRSRQPSEYAHDADDIEKNRVASISPHAPQNAPVVLSFQDLYVTTGPNRSGKILLHGVSGSITGGFWAIMGASGGGKTTLLSALSLRLDTKKMNITGDFRLNGREYSKSVLKAMSAYVMQDDLLHAELTVAETISYAAQLRLPFNTSTQERKDRENYVMDLMGVQHVRDVIIGDTRRKGISGGERKRVCVAIELLRKPQLLFLDEPTSGLDSTTAYDVCHALKNLSDLGVCTVVCTIHQPQVKIFNLFDNLILMKKGKIVYQGSCQKSLKFLESAKLPCPASVNPADHLLDLISPKSNNAFDVNASTKVPVDLFIGVDKSFYASKRVAFRSWFFHFTVLSRRSFQQYYRNTELFWMNFWLTIVLAFFVGSGIWRDIGNAQDSLPKRVPSLFFCAVSQGIVAALQCISSFPSERAIVLRERAAGSYFVSSYFVAKSVVDIATQVLVPTIFSVIVYFMIGYQVDASKFFIFWGFMILDSIAALSLATMIACLCVTLEKSTVALSLLLEIARLYGGFFTSPQQLNDYPGWRFADALSYVKYVFVGVALNELEGLELTCTDAQVSANKCIRSGTTIMEERGYDQYTMGFCAGILIVYIVGCRIVGYVALRYLKS